MQKSSSPELVECEHFEESNSKIHTGMLLLAHADHIIPTRRSSNLCGSAGKGLVH